MIPEVDQYIGNLFYKGVQPSEINAMTYTEMRYFNGWCEVYVEAEKDYIRKTEIRNKGKIK